MFNVKKKKEKEPEPVITSQEKFKILDHSITVDFGKIISVATVRDEDGELIHVLLYNCRIDEDVIEIKGSYVEWTLYDNGETRSRISTK